MNKIEATKKKDNESNISNKFKKIIDYGLISEVGSTLPSESKISESPSTTGELVEVIEPLPKNILFKYNNGNNGNNGNNVNDVNDESMVPVYKFITDTPMATIVMVLDDESNNNNEKTLSGLYLKIGRLQSDNRWVRLNKLTSDKPEKNVTNEIWLKNIGKFIIPKLQIQIT
jgi:hypothetical protein